MQDKGEDNCGTCREGEGANTRKKDSRFGYTTQSDPKLK